MNKITKSFFNQLLDSDLTKIEFNVLINLLQKVNEDGVCVGVYYKDIMTEIKCCQSHFYQVLSSLENKGFIILQHNKSTGDINIQIDNKFQKDSDGNIIYTDYIDINYSVFYDGFFYDLRVGAKKIFLHLFYRSISKQHLTRLKDAKDSTHRFLPNQFIKTYMDKFNLSKRMVKSYLNELSKYISVKNNSKQNNKNYEYVIMSKQVFKKQYIFVTNKSKTRREVAYGSFNFHKNLIKTVCRRSKIACNNMNLSDTAVLIMQYADRAKELGKNSIKVVVDCIYKTHASSLEPKLVHSLVTSILPPSMEDIVRRYKKKQLLK